MEQALALIEAQPEPRRSELRLLFDLVREVAPELEVYLQSDKMIGFGRIRYTGRTSAGEWFVVGLGNNKGPISLYIAAADGHEYVAERWASRLGKVSVGRSCIRIRKTRDVDLPALRSAIAEGVAVMTAA